MEKKYLKYINICSYGKKNKFKIAMVNEPSVFKPLKFQIGEECLFNQLIELGSNAFFSSPEHEVLMVSYCDQSMSVVRRASSVVRRQQFVLKANSS